MSHIGNISNSSVFLLGGEPPKKRARLEEKEEVVDISDRFSDFSALASRVTKEADCRFLPNRTAIQQAQIPDVYLVKPPQTIYQQALMQAVAPYYGSKALLSHLPAPFQPSPESKRVWTIPNKPWVVYETDNDPRSSDFYKHPLDWGSHIYFATGSRIFWKDPLSRVVPRPIILSIGVNIDSIKNSPDLNEIAIGDEKGSLFLFDLRAQQISLSRKVDSTYRGRIFCTSWKRDGAELTMGLESSIVHFDKRQKSKAWGISLQPDEWNCSVDWNRSNVLMGTGNGHVLRVFDERKIQEKDPVFEFETKAGIKALQWNPNNPDLLAIGAGTEDQHLYLFDVKEKKNICSKNIGAQVCDLKWFGNDAEHFAVAAGFGLQTSEVSVWRYRKEVPALEKIGEMPGCERQRTLNLAKDPKSANLCSHSSDHDGTDQKIYIWELESMEEIRKRKDKKNKAPSIEPPSVR